MESLWTFILLKIWTLNSPAISRSISVEHTSYSSCYIKWLSFEGNSVWIVWFCVNPRVVDQGKGREFFMSIPRVFRNKWENHVCWSCRFPDNIWPLVQWNGAHCYPHVSVKLHILHPITMYKITKHEVGRKQGFIKSACEFVTYEVSNTPKQYISNIYFLSRITYC